MPVYKLKIKKHFILFVFNVFVLMLHAQTPSEIYHNQKQQHESEVPIWQNLGPKSLRNLSTYYAGVGRMISVWVSPLDSNHILAGAATGGLWETKNCGNSWHCLTDSLASGVTRIAVNPENQNTIYIATGVYGNGSVRYDGFYGYGIWKSPDGGKNWKQILKVFPSEMVYMTDIKISRTDTSLLYATSLNRIFMSENGGKNWKLVYGGTEKPKKNIFLREILICNDKNRSIIAAGDKKILIKNNKRKHWRNITEKLTHINSNNQLAKSSIAQANDDNNTIYILYSLPNDYKTKLDKYNLKNDTCINVCTSKHSIGKPWMSDICLRISDNNGLYAGGVRLYEYDYEINNFKPLSNWSSRKRANSMHPDVRDIAIFSHKTNDVLFLAHDGGMAKTIGAKRNAISEITNNLSVGQLQGLSIANDTANYMFFGCDDCGTTLLTTNGKWMPQMGGDGGNTLISKKSQNIIFGMQSGGAGGSLKRISIGRESKTIYAGLPLIDMPIVQHPIQEELLFLGSNLLMRSKDYGNTWDTLFLETADPKSSRNRDIRTLAIEISPSQPEIIYIATELWGWAALYRTNGIRLKNNSSLLRWTALQKPLDKLMNEVRITDIAIHKYQPDSVWISLGNFSKNNKIYQSVNGGKQWQNISYNLPNIPVKSIAFDTRTNSLFAGTDQGIFYFSYQHKKWRRYGKHPAMIVKQLIIHEKSRQLIAATYGRGIWICLLPK